MEREAQVSEFEDKVVHINRCAKTVKGGRRMSFSALVVVGNKNGKVGVGLGKAKEVSEAIRKGTEAAQRNIAEVQLLDGTIPHDIEVKSGSTRILLMPAAPGTGVIAGAAARAVPSHKSILPSFCSPALSPGNLCPALCLLVCL